MKQTTTWMAFAAATVLTATVAFGQTDEAATAETEEATTTEDGLSLGTPEGPALGERYIAETFGDWAYRCVKTDLDTDPCQMYQLLQDSEGNSVAEIALNRLSNGGQAVAGANLIVPLETMLTEQVTIRVDNGQGRQYPFAVCTQIGCLARIGLTAGDIASYKAGVTASIRIVPFAAPDQQVVLPMSLTGFTAAFDNLQSN